MEMFSNFPRQVVRMRWIPISHSGRISYGNGQKRMFKTLVSSSTECRRRQVLSLAPLPSTPFHHCHHQYAQIQKFESLSSWCTQSRNVSSSVVRSSKNDSSEAERKQTPEEETGQSDDQTTDIALPKRRKDRRKLSDLIVKKSEIEEAKDKLRYENYEPPEEEPRHKYWKSKSERSINKALVRIDFFERIQDKTKENFIATLEMFPERDVHLRGHVEFIYAALSQMKKFGVHRDLDAYKKIIDIFPKGKMIASNMFQVEFQHYPKQQQCAIDILEQMEEFAVCPDTETQIMLTNVFGRHSLPMRKAGRMLYWMPKFKNISPWRLPDPLPDDCLELAKFAIERMTSVDLSTKITVFNTENLEDAYDQTWIVSGQSPEQQKLIELHDSKQPIYVEGAFRVWVQRICINYFILRAEPKKLPETTADPDDVGDLTTIFHDNYKEKALDVVPSVHEQDDGVILGICATGTSSRDSVVSWIRFLEESNPRLGKDVSILFTLKSPIGPTDDLEIPSIEEARKQLPNPDEMFSVSSGGKFGLDPRLPNLKQMGIWSESETQFANWPHDNHPPESSSFKHLQANRRFLDELEKQIQAKSNRTSDSSSESLSDDHNKYNDDDKKQIK